MIPIRPVLDFLVVRYGEFVLLKPVFSAQTLVLWGLPVLALALGGGAAFRLFDAGRRMKNHPGVTWPANPQRSPIRNSRRLQSSLPINPGADPSKDYQVFIPLKGGRYTPGAIRLLFLAAIAMLHGGQMRLEDHAPALRAVLVLPRASGNDPVMTQPDAPLPLISRLTKAPKAGKAGKAGARRVADLLASEEGADLRPLLADASLAADLLAGIAEGAPYLWRLISRCQSA